MKKRKLKKSVWALLALIITAFCASTSIAFLMNNSSLINTFKVGSVDSEIIESFKNNVKSDVKVKNTGNSSAYVRCQVLTYYEYQNGSETFISNEIPQINTDYTIDFGDDWIDVNGIYYYKYPLDAGKSTTPFIRECRQVSNSKKGNLVVDIFAQMIQAKPSRAVEESWKDVSVDSSTSTLELIKTVN